MIKKNINHEFQCNTISHFYKIKNIDVVSVTGKQTMCENKIKPKYRNILKETPSAERLYSRIERNNVLIIACKISKLTRWEVDAGNIKWYEYITEKRKSASIYDTFIGT